MATETITQVSQPWSAQQPFLTSLFNRADNLYKQGPLQPYGGDWVANFSPDTVSGMNSIRSAAGDPSAINQALGSWGNMIGGNYLNQSGIPGYANNTFQNLSQYGAGAGTPGAGTFNFLQNPGNYGANPYAMNSLAGFQRASMPGAVQNALGGLSSQSYGANPFSTSALQNYSNSQMPSFVNDSLSGIAQGGIGGVNSQATNTLNSLSNRGYGPSGQVTNALNSYSSGSNPYLDAMYNQAASRMSEAYREGVAPSIQSQFASAGRSGGNMALDNALQNSRQEFGDQLNNLANSMYGSQYQSDMNRGLQATGMLGDLQMQGQQLGANTQLGAASQLGNLSQQNSIANANARTNAAQAAGGLYNQNAATGINAALGLGGLTQDANALTANTQMGAANSYGNLWNNMLNSQIGAAGTMGNLSQNANNSMYNSMLGSATNYGNLYNQAAGMNADTQLGAAQAAGSLGNQAYLGGLNNMTSALGMSPQMSQLPYAGGNALMSLGQYDQQQRQAEINALMDKYNFKQQAPWDLLSRYGSTIQGNYGSTGQTTSPIYEPSTMQNVLGGGLLLNSLAGNPLGGFLGGLF